MQTEKNKIFPEDGMTWKNVTNKEGGIDKKLLIDCILEIKAVDETEEHYLFKIKNKHKLIKLSGLSTPQAFKSFIRPYTYHGSASDIELLLNAYRTEFEGNMKTLINLKSFIGKYEDDDFCFWVLESTIIFLKKNGEKVYEVEMFKNYYVLEGENKIYYIDNFNISNELVPKNFDEGDCTIEEFMEGWYGQYNDHILLTCLLGWFIALMHQDKVVELRKLRAFPYFTLAGLTANGKTSLLTNCMKFWGVDYVGDNYSETSPHVEIKTLTQISKIPIWRDEYREHGRYTQAKEGILRSMYNLGTLSKGTASQELIRYQPQTTLLISGEDINPDPAVRRRMIHFQMDKRDRVDASAWQKAIDNGMYVFPKAFKLFLQMDFDEEVFKEIYAMPFESINAPLEEKVCYAALGAVIGKDFGVAALNKASEYWAAELQKNNNQTQDTAEAFFEALHNLAVNNEWYEEKSFGMNTYLPKIQGYIEMVDDEIHIHHAPVISKVLDFNQFGKKFNFTANAIRDIIKSKFEAEIKVIRFKQKPTRCMVITKENAIRSNALIEILNHADPSFLNPEEKVFIEEAKRSEILDFQRDREGDAMTRYIG